jgi:hypothetical protein
MFDSVRKLLCHRTAQQLNTPTDSSSSSTFTRQFKKIYIPAIPHHCPSYTTCGPHTNKSVSSRRSESSNSYLPE